MKTLLVAVCTLILAHAAPAQQLDEPNRLLFLSKYEDAKKEIDKIFANSKAGENPQACLLKSKIYAEIFFDEVLRTKYPDAGDQAYRAIGQYVLLEPSLKSLRESNGMRAVSIIYSSRFNEGRKFFSESKWEEALKSFTIAEDLGDFISKNGLGRSKQSIDTFTVVYAGYAAQNAQNTARALYYYKKFAAEKIGGQAFIEIYRYLLNASMADKNPADFTRYLTLAKTLYPDEQLLWSAYEIEFVSKNAGVAPMLAKYKTEDQAGKLRSNEYAIYAEYFGNIPADELKKLSTAEQFDVKTVASHAFGKAFALERNGIYAFNAGILLYQQHSTLEGRIDALRGTAAEVKTKRDPLEKQQQQLADMSVEWLEKAYSTLKVKTKREDTEISALSKSVDFLAALYQWKRDKAGDKNAAAYKTFDAKYKQYSAEQGMYK